MFEVVNEFVYDFIVYTWPRAVGVLILIVYTAWAGWLYQVWREGKIRNQQKRFNKKKEE